MKDYSWVDDYIESSYNNGKVLIAQAFEILMKDIKKQYQENISLKKEIRKLKTQIKYYRNKTVKIKIKGIKDNTKWLN